MVHHKLTASAFFAVSLAACSGETLYQPNHFEAAPAIDLLEALSTDEMKGRKVGTEENAKARDMIIERFQALGVVPGAGGYELPFAYGPFEDASAAKSGINILGHIEGTADSDISMIITAHYDHVGEIDGEIYNGADDNASGVVGLVAAAEYFAANPPKHDIAFLAFDAEEDGLGGSIAYVANPPTPLGDVALNINFDMLSRGDNGKLWASGTAHWPDMKPIVSRVAESAPVQIEMGFDQGEAREDWTLLSDHAAFFRAGIPHVYFGVEDHADYHKPSDDFENINQDWFLKSVDSVVMMAIAMDAQLDEIYDMRQAALGE
jgi:Zn-dependent M28 family amino/carboxypeptidase